MAKMSYLVAHIDGVDYRTDEPTFDSWPAEWPVPKTLGEAKRIAMRFDDGAEEYIAVSDGKKTVYLYGDD